MHKRQLPIALRKFPAKYMTFWQFSAMHRDSFA
jgi:hypothetical protein